MNATEETGVRHRTPYAIAALRHIFKVLEHKWYVFRAGRRLGVPIRRLLVHDLSKFSRIEVRGYAYKFFNGPGTEADWRAAWEHHWRNNTHHWECWRIEDSGAIAMPDDDAREMVADWMAASRAYSGAWPEAPTKWRWWQENKDRIVLHPHTHATVVRLIKIALEKP